jgi:regulator of nucleoside diphosphate kinase
MMTRPLQPVLTQRDLMRLERSIVEAHRGTRTAVAGTSELESLLDEATVVRSADVASDVVTMNSRVVVEDPLVAGPTTVTLVYPADADPERGKVSVLAPLGRALLGARVRDLRRVEVPGNASRQVRISAILYQPEAAGDFDL